MTDQHEYTDLREEYIGVESTLTELSIIVPRGDCFHRPSKDGETPACSTTSDRWRVVDTDDALRLGMVPCRGCWEGATDYLAAEVDDSGVEYRNGEAVDDITGQDIKAVLADGGAGASSHAQKLTSRPEEVLVASTLGTGTYHAPSVGGPHCGTGGEFRRVKRVKLAGHADPCSSCFEVEEIDTSEP